MFCYIITLVTQQVWLRADRGGFDCFLQTVAAASREQVTQGPGTAVQVDKTRG